MSPPCGSCVFLLQIYRFFCRFLFSVQTRCVHSFLQMIFQQQSKSPPLFWWQTSTSITVSRHMNKTFPKNQVMKNGMAETDITHMCTRWASYDPYKLELWGSYKWPKIIGQVGLFHPYKPASVEVWENTYTVTSRFSPSRGWVFSLGCMSWKCRDLVLLILHVDVQGCAALLPGDRLGTS